eukprot:TRINITY_DN39980_c0_g1_i1.p1 TRINITY_DN39980_c0_g1~~TRINITY_DN39980_c0_g1_i1.p1  ORF type:complete len:540 (-),score=115.03 TRINITY_DN39980_c0_g1_i1:106-1725(-)
MAGRSCLPAKASPAPAPHAAAGRGAERSEGASAAAGCGDDGGAACQLRQGTLSADGDGLALATPLLRRTSSGGSGHGWGRAFAGKMEGGLADSTGQIGVLAVLALSFFNVSGGPWGSEDVFGAGGPLLGCCGILSFALFFCIPQCLVTAELSCVFPCGGGYSVWVREAFGDFWGVQECVWQWTSGVVDTAVYPVLICDTALQLFGLRLDALSVWLCRVGVAAVLSLPTAVSTSTVSTLLVGLAAATLLPVAAFVVCGLPHLDTTAWFQEVEGRPIEYSKFVNTLFWNLEGWDCISTCAAMLVLPRERTIRRGLALALLVVVLQYLLVLLVAAGLGGAASQPWQEWTDGSLPSIGGAQGPIMSGALLAASVVGNAGQYLAEFMEVSVMLQGAADVGIAPAAFAWRPLRSDVPLAAVVFQFAIVVLLVSFDFSDILVFDNCFTALAAALQFAAFFKLRQSHPELHRPYKVPSYMLILFGPACLVLGMVLYECLSKSSRGACISLGALALSAAYGAWVSRREDCAHAIDELLEEDAERKLTS